MDVVGIHDGFKWLAEGDTSHATSLTIEATSRWHFRGGSYLGISRVNPLRTPESFGRTAEALENLGIGMLMTIGGDGTAMLASLLAEKLRGRLRVVHVPKTIDNDIALPDEVSTFGFQTARHIGVELVKNLMVDAKTTSRWYFVVAQGRKAGHLALAIGKAVGATTTLIPEEFPRGATPMATIVDHLAGSVIKRLADGRSDGVAMLAEGLADCIAPEDLARYTNVPKDERGNIHLAELNLGNILAGAVKERLAKLGVKTTLVSKEIGYEVRCADPIPFDMEYTRDLGYSAARYIIEGGNEAMVAMVNGRFQAIPFSEMRDPVTGNPRVRMVDIDSDRYRIAYAYMLRLKREDFESVAQLERLARVVNLSVEDFRAQFHHVVEPRP